MAKNSISSPLNQDSRRLIGLGFLIALVISLPLLVWGITTGNFDIRERAALVEDTTISMTPSWSSASVGPSDESIDGFIIITASGENAQNVTGLETYISYDPSLFENVEVANLSRDYKTELLNQVDQTNGLIKIAYGVNLENPNPQNSATGFNIRFKVKPGINQTTSFKIVDNPPSIVTLENQDTNALDRFNNKEVTLKIVPVPDEPGAYQELPPNQKVSGAIDQNDTAYDLTPLGATGGFDFYMVPLSRINASEYSNYEVRFTSCNTSIGLTSCAPGASLDEEMFVFDSSFNYLGRADNVIDLANPTFAPSSVRGSRYYVAVGAKQQNDNGQYEIVFGQKATSIPTGVIIPPTTPTPGTTITPGPVQNISLTADVAENSTVQPDQVVRFQATFQLPSQGTPSCANNQANAIVRTSGADWEIATFESTDEQYWRYNIDLSTGTQTLNYQGPCGRLTTVNFPSIVRTSETNKEIYMEAELPASSGSGTQQTALVRRYILKTASGIGGDDGADDWTINFKVKFAGLTKNVADRYFINNAYVSPRVKLQFVRPNVDPETTDEDINVHHIGNGIYEGSVTIPKSQVPQGQYNIKVKGEKHLARRFCLPEGQSGICPPNQFRIEFNNNQSTYNFDFTGQELRVGDLPGFSHQNHTQPDFNRSGQDGQAGNSDFQKMNQALHVNPSDTSEEYRDAVFVADLNYDGSVNVIDFGLFWSSFGTQFDD